MTDALDRARLRALYEAFSRLAPTKDAAAHFDLVSALRDAPPDAFADADLQARLWNATALGDLGVGEDVDVGDAPADPQIVARLVALRDRKWPVEVNARAAAVQDACDALVAAVTERTEAKQRPLGRVYRVLLALLPEHLHAAVAGPAAKEAARLVLGERRERPVTTAVLVRGRLRNVLGDEAHLGDHVQRARFCAWLAERADDIRAGAAPDDLAGIAPEPDAPPITPWAPSRQRKGMGPFAGYVEAIRDLVRASEGGLPRDELVEALRNDFGYTQGPSTTRELVRNAVGLGFLDRDGAILTPTDAGYDLLDSDPPDVFVDALLVRVYGPAHVLRALTAGTVTAQEICDALDGVFPTWADRDTPVRWALLWLGGAGLVERDGWRYRLTSYGRHWASRLPDDLPVMRPSPVVAVDDDEPAPTDAPTALVPVSFAELWARFSTDPELAAYVFPRELVRTLHVAWHFHDHKRFALLSGLSGAGKTQLVRHYARIYCACLGLDVNVHARVVPVSPDWRDPTGLLGYFNALHADPTYQREPALELLLAAGRDPGRPYFLVLDEMNLARVERYFAPFLSAMETGEPIHVHAHDEHVNGVPPSTPWPRNLFVAGTVNMDETTHPFSDKVLDRAFTMEFWEVDLRGFFARRRTAGRPIGERFEELLVALNDILYGVRRHFGYRTAGEVVDWAHAARRADPDADEASLVDQAVFSKVLPRLRGDESPGLIAALEAVEALCREWELPLCTAKLASMRERLTHTGVTSFWS